MLRSILLLLIFILTSCGDNANIGINPDQPNVKPSSPLVTPAKVSAVDDNTSLEQGSTSNIDILINDTFNGSPSITIVSENNINCDIVGAQVSANTTNSTIGSGLCVYQICDSNNICSQANININIFSPASPDLQVSKSVNTPSAAVGSNVIFTLSVKNNGPVDASAVALTDLLPSSLQYVSSSASVGSYNSTSGIWSIGSLANGATATLTITAKVLAAASGTSVTNTITNVTSANGDANGSPDDNTAVVNVGVAAPDLQVSKSVNTPSAAVGSNVIFTLSVKNNGPVDASAVALTDLLPSSLQYVSSSASVGSYNSTSGIWSIGSLANGATATLTITAKVLAAASGTSVTNTITNVTSANGDANGSPDDNTAVVNVGVAAPAIDAVNDSYTAGHNILSSLNVLSNDTFTLSSGTVSIVSGSNGTCTWNSTTHLINFLPNLGFSGNANCVYKICQGSTCDTATATVLVAPFKNVLGPNQPIGCKNIATTYPSASLPKRFNQFGQGTSVSPYVFYTAEQCKILQNKIFFHLLFILVFKAILILLL